MMTLHKLTVGDGYTYLIRHIARSDSEAVAGPDGTDYYTAHGNPPGRWGGRGAAQLDLEGEVDEPQMRHLFGQGMHPDADRIIAAYLAEHTKPGMAEEQVEALAQAAIRAATLGRRFPVYQTLEHFDDRVEQRLDVIRTETGREPTQAEIGRIRAEEARRARGGVAGYDLVFTPVKSLVLLWALDERQWIRDAVRAAHEQARDSALALLEEHAAFTRTGDVGQAQLATHGLIYARFDHYDSRDGDPNLHTHVAVVNKIRGVDGRWRSLDGQALYRIGVAASEHYNSTVETVARQLLGVDFAVRPDTIGKRHPVREVVGVPLAWLKTFSARRAQIEARYEDLVVEYRRLHGHDPANQVAFRLAEQANLDTRGPKPAPRSLSALREEWTARLAAIHGRQARRALAAVVADGRRDQIDVTQVQVTALASLTVGRAENTRSTWTVWNLRAEADRLLREPPTTLFPGGLPFTDTAHRTAVLTRVVETAVAACVPVTIEPDLAEPAALRRADGTSVYVRHGAARYTSQAILDAEQRLLDAARTPVATVLPTVLPTAAQVAAILDRFEADNAAILDAGQRAMVIAFATDPNLITVGLGPAGAGKTTTMRAYRHVLTAQGRRLIPLASSAAAAAVLAADLGVPAENVHKFVFEHLTRPSDTFHVRPGDVILVDEAGLAGTRNLDTLREIAERHGAQVRLLGDHRQLSAVESGGALRLLATEAGATELAELHRFTSPAEADATRRLRDGDTTALDHYQTHNRIVGGSAEAMTEQAYTAWHTDMTNGSRTLLVASTTAGVTALSARARTDRVAAGQVEPDGVTLHDGNRAGRGDWIVTRSNHRRLTCNRGRDWVRNGDGWTVTARLRDGVLKVKHHGHGGTVTLPADYVTAHVELLYATTVHRAQGVTVDTAHALVTDDMTRETLYVAASRARHRTTLYAVTHRVLPLDEDARMDRTVYDRHARAPREVLETVLGTQGAQPSATEAIAQAADDARSLATLVPRLRHSAEKADDLRLRQLVSTTFGTGAAAVLADPAWSAVIRALRAAEADGWDLQQVLAGTARRGPLSAGESPAPLLAWRITDHVDGRTPTPALARPSLPDAARYASLLRPKLHAEAVLDPAEAVHQPRLLHIHAGTTRTDHTRLLAAVLGETDAARATAEPAWPALRAAIRRAEHAGHDPITVVATAALSRRLAGARSLSQVLAWRIAKHLDTTPPPVEPHTADAWRTLAWTLKAAEDIGHPAEQLLAAVRPGGDADSIRTQLHGALRPTPTVGVLPWLSITPAVSAADWRTHLDTATDAVQQRRHEITMRAITDRPAWLAGLGAAPTGAHQYARWLGHVGVVAAYRDQHQITLDELTQPLGAYQPAHAAGHRAFLHAADAVIAARHPHVRPLDPTTARICADIYLALPDTDRDTITAAVAERLDCDWLGPRHGDADALLTSPAYARHLHAELVVRGHIQPAPVAARTTAPTAPSRPPVIRQRRIQPPVGTPQPETGIEITR